MDKKDKKEFDNPFIPISELGMSSEGFTVNANELYEALYESYCACCQSKDADKAPSSENDFGKDKPLTSHQMATVGRAGQFMWYALTSVFDENIHVMDDFKLMHNKHHVDAACDILESPSNNLQYAINNDAQLASMFHEPIVINITEYNNYYGNNYGAYGNYYNYLQHMSNFFTGSFAVEDVFTHITRNDGTKVIRIDPSKVKGKDVVIPQIIATRQTIELFKKIAMFVCKNGAKSAIGLFITRIKPTMDGREPQKVDDKYAIQPLGPRFLGGLGIPVV